MTPTESASTPEQTSPKEVDITKKAMLLALRFGRFGNSRKLQASIDVELHQGDKEQKADNKQFKVQKQLLDSPDLKAIQTLDGEISRTMNGLCVPAFLMEGVRFIPKAAIELADKTLTDFAKTRKDLVKIACQSYPGRQLAAKIDLGVAYNETDYPSVEEFEKSFVFDWQYLSFGLNDLESVAPSVFEAERERQSKRLEQVSDSIQRLMRAELASVVGNLVDKLTGARENGKPKVFRDSTVNNIREFLSTFKLRNITEDAELDRLVAQVDMILRGVDPDLLRSDDALRDRVRESMGQVATELDSMLIDEPERRIAL